MADFLDAVVHGVSLLSPDQPLFGLCEYAEHDCELRLAGIPLRRDHENPETRRVAEVQHAARGSSFARLHPTRTLWAYVFQPESI